MPPKNGEYFEHLCIMIYNSGESNIKNYTTHLQIGVPDNFIIDVDSDRA